jgi:antitoxin component YwqK of YwqJK toxin-antitoxin module
MKVKVVICILFLTFYSCSSQSINESDLTSKDNLWFSNNSLFSGEVYQIVRMEKKILGRMNKGIKEDFWIEFGSLIWREGAYIDGNKSGNWNGFYVDSTRAFSGDYKNGLKVGLWNGWNKKGSVIYRGEYIEGKKSNNWMYYYDNGQLSDSGKYKNDVMSGYWQYYYENGSLMKEGDYNDQGEEISRWVYYNTDGTIKEKKEFKSKE